MARRFAAQLVLALMLSAPALAIELSTSVMRPTPIEPSGVIEGQFPDAGKGTYYFSLDAQPGDLLTQISYDGRPGAQKSIDLALLDADARSQGNYWVQGTEPSEAKTRSFAIDRKGPQVIRLEVEGPPTARFRAEVGGPAAASLQQKKAAGEALSRSVFTPTLVQPDGVVGGKLPGVDTNATYYVAVDLQKGDLLTQISVNGREGADKELDFALLESDARVGEQYWVHGEGASEEKTRSFAIDKAGRHVIKLVVSGPETATFKVELGGTALVSRPATGDGSAMADPRSY
jgi:hypothetical protein